MFLSPECAMCDRPSAFIELIRPGELPMCISSWTAERSERYVEWADLDTWRMRYRGPSGGSGDIGVELTPSRAETLIEVFTPPIKFDRLSEVGLYDRAGICTECRLPYCDDHWSISSSGFGHCPEGHGKSLDPHLSPN